MKPISDTARWLAVALAVMLPATSAAKSYHLSDYDVEIDVAANGDLHVAERLTYSFDKGTFTYAHREIPVHRFDRIEFVSLTSPDGMFNIDKQRVRDGWTRELELKWSFPRTSGSRTFRIRYVAEGVLIGRGDRHVLDWAAVGDDWDVSIFDVDVVVRLPGEMESAVTTRPAAKTSVRDDRTEVAFRRDRVDRGDGFRVVVEFPRMDGVREASPDDTPDYALVVTPGLVGVAFLLAGLWWRVARVERKAASGRAVSWPAPEIGVAEATCLAHFGQRARRSVMAIIFDLARRGILRVHARAKEGFFGARSFEIEVRRHGGTEDLAAWERKVVKELNADPRLKKLGERSGKISRIIDDVRDGLRDRGLISSDREALRAKWLTGSALLAAVATIFFGIVLVGVLRELLAPAILALAAGWGATAVSASIETRTPRALTLAATFRGYGREQRAEIESLVGSDPAKAVSRLVERLPELALDAGVTADWFKNIRKKFRDRRLEFVLPPWMELRGSRGDAADTTLAAAVAFEAFAEVAGSVVAYAGGGSGGGGGGGGGAGGGGGGAG